jgi:prepilin-type N-terminal cleavage/methylation domain-containing protein
MRRSSSRIAGRVFPPGSDDAGFTLIEMLVTLFITGVIFAAFGLVISTTVRHTALITNEGVAQHQVRTSLNQLTQDLREATVSSTSDTSPFVTTAGVMSPTSLTFYAPDNSYTAADPTDYHLREISYQLSGGSLQRRSVVSANVNGPPWTIPSLGGWVSLIDGVTNSTVFTYYDGSQPPALTTNPAAVRTVVVTTTVSVAGTPNHLTYSESATLRETPPS